MPPAAKHESPLHVVSATAIIMHFIVTSPTKFARSSTPIPPVRRSHQKQHGVEARRMNLGALGLASPIRAGIVHFINNKKEKVDEMPHARRKPCPVKNKEPTLTSGSSMLSTVSHRSQSTSLATMVPSECAISTTCNWDRCVARTMRHY